MQVIAGKGHETYQIEGDKKEFFDDREECREALQYVDELHQAGIDTSEFPWRWVHSLLILLNYRRILQFYQCGLSRSISYVELRIMFVNYKDHMSMSIMIPLYS